MQGKTTLSQFFTLSDSTCPIIIERSDMDFVEWYRGTIYGLYHNKKVTDSDKIIITSIYPVVLKLKQVHHVNTFIGMKLVCRLDD